MRDASPSSGEAHTQEALGFSSQSSSNLKVIFVFVSMSDSL